MLEEWNKRYSTYRYFKKPEYPKDNWIYEIPIEAVNYSEKVLREYGSGRNPTEGLIYWGGIRNANIITIKSVFAPRTSAFPARIETDQRANFEFVRALSKLNQVQIGQVHSHPSSFIDHSEGDDDWCAFKFEGLLSLVIANYCSNGIMPIEECGIHRFSNENFVRLSKKYIKAHFKIINGNGVDFIDLR